MPSSEIALLDDALPLVRADEPWQWFVVFWEDETETVPTDLTGIAVTAEIRWRGGVQAVTAEVLDAVAGHVRLSLTAEETVVIPYGRLSRLFIALDGDTEAMVPVNALEGLYSV